MDLVVAGGLVWLSANLAVLLLLGGASLVCSPPRSRRPAADREAELLIEELLGELEQHGPEGFLRTREPRPRG